MTENGQHQNEELKQSASNTSLPASGAEQNNTGSKKSTKTEKMFRKAAVIIGMLMLLQLPLYLIRYQMGKRILNQEAVQQEIAAVWGEKQIICCSGNSYLSDLTVDAKVTSEIRYRGIYQLPVYIAEVQMDMQFVEPRDSYRIRISDSNAVQSVSAQANGRELACQVDQKGVVIQNESGVSACRVTLKLRGSGQLMFETVALHNNIQISGNWGDPSFVGTVLPVTRSVESDNFSASWNINNLRVDRGKQSVGVDFLITAGSYQRIERTMTYATFFLIVFFFTLFAGELLAKSEIHIAQYVVASGAPVLFYLLLLALSEHSNFPVAYVISAAVIVLMVTAYAKMFMKKYAPALILGVVFAVSYAVNYLILQMEDFALLTGTLILTVILAILMLATGRINQQKNGEEPENLENKE